MVIEMAKKIRDLNMAVIPGVVRNLGMFKNVDTKWRDSEEMKTVELMVFRIKL